MPSNAKVMLWGKVIGFVSWEYERSVASFQYNPDFVDQSGMQLSPRHMPLGHTPYVFPLLDRDTYMGLPGLLADSLPDTFGNALISVWLDQTGRTENDFTPVDRLCYVGHRGKGALEYEPALSDDDTRSRKVEVKQLLELANVALQRQKQLSGRMAPSNGSADLNAILRVGGSAGGARAKALLAWNPQTNEFRSGEIEAEPGFKQWLLKFDGVSPKDGVLADPQGYGKIEYAYHLMARAAGITMADCRLHEEGGRSHFMTRRFDRDAQGEKVHMQSLWAMEHFHFGIPPRHSYEQAINAIKNLEIGMDAIEEQYRRAVFNVMARNQDDHVKNVAFLMDKEGVWSLAPAYDVIYAYNPAFTASTREHQMSLAGKRDKFKTEDLMTFAKTAGIKPTKAKACIKQVAQAVKRWSEFAKDAKVSPKRTEQIQTAMRGDLVAAGISKNLRT